MSDKDNLFYGYIRKAERIKRTCVIAWLPESEAGTGRPAQEGFCQAQRPRAVSLTEVSLAVLLVSAPVSVFVFVWVSASMPMSVLVIVMAGGERG